MPPLAGPIRRFLPTTLALPVVTSSLGIDGGPIFQIFASEDLGLSATAIGVAFGLGVLSLPVQLWAARMPLWRARRNLQVFLAVAAVQAWLLAVLVAKGQSSGFAGLALGITVTAEISLSVLYATAWQPLLSFTLSSVERQWLNARARALGGAVLAVSVLVFNALTQSQRAVFLAAVGVVAVGLAVSMRHVTAPARPPVVVTDDDSDSHTHSRTDNDRDSDTSRRRRRPAPIPPTVRLAYVVFALVNLGALPLLLVYVHDVLWPSANLGLVGALQLAGALIASLTWRPTADGVVTRARIAGCVLVGAAVTLASVRVPVVHLPAEVVTLIAVTATAMAITTIRIALLELAHRSIDEHSSVRAFTLLDVVASTSVQVGLLAGGLLVSASVNVPGWAVDPYRAYVLACSVAALFAIGPLGRMSGERAVTPAADRL